MKEKKIVVVGGRIVIPEGIIDEGILIMEGEKITAVGQASEIKAPKNAEMVIAQDKIVAPGFIDIHLHGGGGRDTNEATEKAIDEIAKTHVKFGTTGFLPTVITASPNNMLNSIRAANFAKEKGTNGAEVLGVYLEGPFLNPKEFIQRKKGSQPQNYIRQPSVKEVEEWFKEARNFIKIVTLAPETKGALGLIKILHKHNIKVAIGHSNATYVEAKKAVDLGLSHVTHIFNGMRELHHREPGIVGLALTTDKLTAEIIVDNLHVHPEVIKLLIKAKGTDKVILITDATRNAGMEISSNLSNRKGIFDNNVAVVSNNQLSGTALTMNLAVRNMVNSVGVPLYEAIKMASLNPAKAIGLDDKKGSISPGKDADIVIIDDDINVFRAIIKGKTIFEIPS